jgi:hypothetical protein
MDLITLAMTKPKVIDLTKFKGVYNEAEVTINDVVLVLTLGSIQDGGTSLTATVTSIDNLFDAVGSNRDIIIKSNFMGNTDIETRATVACYNSMPVQLSVNHCLVFEGTMVDFNATFVKVQSGVSIYVCAKPIS